jgi:hypothetical protein
LRSAPASKRSTNARKELALGSKRRATSTTLALLQNDCAPLVNPNQVNRILAEADADRSDQ